MFLDVSVVCVVCVQTAVARSWLPTLRVCVCLCAVCLRLSTSAHDCPRLPTRVLTRMLCVVCVRAKRLRPPQLVASPGSSLLWIRYMALQVSLTEVEAARRVAERALATIPFRNEQEKLNVW